MYDHDNWHEIESDAQSTDVGEYVLVKGFWHEVKAVKSTDKVTLIHFEKFALMVPNSSLLTTRTTSGA